MTTLVCIVCPKGCRLSVDKAQAYKVSGHDCKRGEVYGKAEMQNPTRMVTSTVKVRGGAYRRCPVKTLSPIPKARMMDAVRLLDGIELTAPVAAGQIVVEDICGTGIPFVTTRSMQPDSPSLS